MRGRREERIERAMDLAAAGLLAGATGFSAFRLLTGTLAQPCLSVCAGGMALVGLIFASRFLRVVGPQPPAFELRTFAFPDFGFEDVEELVLTDADRLQPAAENVEGCTGELMLDDILAELAPDSRVVRLFDRSAMPTPGQLNARIERHLLEASASVPATDASEALYQALSELRRSLR